jgi:DNA-binding response OmpR family regulator
VTLNRERRSVILVVEDVEETRYGMERLLATSGYQVSTARDEEEAVLKAGLQRPDLILISLGLGPTRNVAIAKRIRELSALGEEVPAIILGAASLDEGTEVGVGFNIYLTRPDNFDQLRAFLSRLLRKLP